MFQYDPLVAGTPSWVEPLRAKLSAAVKARKLTQTQIAKASGLTPSAVSQFLDHTTVEPSGNLLIEGCRLLQISVDELTGLTHEDASLRPAASAEDSRAFLQQLANALVDVIAAADAGQQTTKPRTHTTGRAGRDRTDR